jgi:hypothetical protein
MKLCSELVWVGCWCGISILIVARLRQSMLRVWLPTQCVLLYLGGARDSCGSFTTAPRPAPTPTPVIPPRPAALIAPGLYHDDPPSPETAVAAAPAVPPTPLVPLVTLVDAPHPLLAQLDVSSALMLAAALLAAGDRTEPVTVDADPPPPVMLFQLAVSSAATDSAASGLGTAPGDSEGTGAGTWGLPVPPGIADIRGASVP